MILTESDREVVVNYLAVFFAEDFAGCERDHFEACHGWSSGNERFLYHVVRTETLFGLDPAHPNHAEAGGNLFPLEKCSDEKLVQFYIDRFDFDTGEYMMDKFVTGLVLSYALDA
jgi:hypothetical protein